MEVTIGSADEQTGTPLAEVNAVLRMILADLLTRQAAISKTRMSQTSRRP
jgi:hypothetical protein